MSTTDWTPVQTAVRAALEDLDGVCERAAVVIRERVPEYANVPDDQLTVAMRRNLGALLRALLDRRFLRAEDLRDFELTVENRARSGVPLDEYLLAVTAAEASMWEQLWEGYATDVPAEQRLEAFALRYANITTITRVTATAHRSIELRTAREEHERRALSLRSLLGGGLSSDELKQHVSRLGLDPNRQYVVVQARGRGPVDTDQVQRSLVGRRNHPPHAAFALWGDDVVGLLAEPPHSADLVTAGTAGPASLDSLAPAHEQARAALQTALALGLTGTHSLAGLGLRANVQASPEVGRVLREKYLAPLQLSGSLGDELLATVRAYLETGSKRDGAAARLHIHINTVGYRIGRFAELTGADLSDLTVLAELWWLFADLDMRPT